MDESVQKHREQPAELAEWATTLLLAADLIDVRGLCKTGGFDDLQGRLCVLGAIDVVRGYEPGDGMFIQDNVVLDAVAAMTSGIGGEHIPAWNDHPERTKDEVVAKLRAVALGG